MIDEFIKHYENKAMQKFGTKPGDIVIKSSKGLFTYQVDSPCLLIKAVCGDGVYWEEFSTQLAKALGLKQKIFVTKRSPRAWARKYGYSFIRYYHDGVMMGKEVV